MMNNKNNNLKKICMVCGGILLIIIALCLFAPRPYNSKMKLNLISAYGDNEAYHPKVLSFEDKWNGYKYWMAYTPYPAKDDSKENPHIVASNNLINWETPNGLTNPIDELYHDGEPQKYDSDTHLVYNPDLDRIECYWRYVNDVDNEAIIYGSYSENGSDFSEKEVFIKSNNRKKLDYVSPAIIYENGTYKMWYVDQKKVQYKEKENGKDWTKAVVVPIAYEDSDLLKTWHLDVEHTQKGYEMLTVAYIDVEKRDTMSLYYTYSENETKNWSKGIEILKPTTTTNFWDNSGLYRSCMLYEDGVYIIFYGGNSKDDDHGIGIVYGKDITKLKTVNVNFVKDKDSDKMLKLIEKEKQKQN